MTVGTLQLFNSIPTSYEEVDYSTMDERQNKNQLDRRLEA